MAPSEASFLEATAGSTSPSAADPSTPVAPVRTPHVVRVCVIPRCARPHHARGWCQLHYLRWRRHGDPLTLLHEVGPNPFVCVCAFPDADSHRAFGMCHTCGRKPLALFSPGAWERHEERLFDLALAAKRSVTR